MNPQVILLIDIAAFGAVAVVVLMLARRVLLGLDVQRRIRGEAATAAGPSASVVRREEIQNPILAWVQRAFLDDPNDRSELRVALVQAGYDVGNAGVPIGESMRIGAALRRAALQTGAATVARPSP